MPTMPCEMCGKWRRRKVGAAEGPMICRLCREKMPPDEYRCTGVILKRLGGTRCKHWKTLGEEYCPLHRVNILKVGKK